MLNVLGFILKRLRSGGLTLLTVVGILLLVWGTLSPVGTLVWWIEQGAESLSLSRRRDQADGSPDLNAQASQQNPGRDISCYIVFLPGVGDFSADQLTPGEAQFLEELVQAHSHCVAVSEVFPYSVANESLGGRRPWAFIWRFAEQADGWLKNANILIKIRNLWRFAISVDDRYGPVYNRGIANAVIDRMNEVHPIDQVAQKPVRVVLIGTSGGAQVALGAATYLSRWLEAEIVVLSVGGVFAGEKGVNETDHLYHLYGDRDWVDNLGNILFPARWPWTVGSPFNQAIQQGRYDAYRSGPHNHDGPEGYFGQEPIPGKDLSYVELTLQQVNRLPIWQTEPRSQPNSTPDANADPASSQP